MFNDTRHLKVGELKGKAEKLGMDKKQFSDCLNSEKFASQVNAEIAEGNRFGVNSTPIFFVNGIIVKGAKPFSEFEKIILEELRD
jgi:protein-disulfide isomerase